MSELPKLDNSADGDEMTEILRVWTTTAGERVVLRTDTLPPAAWGLILVDVAKHVAYSYSKQGNQTANAAFAQVIQGFIAELGHATDSPTEGG